MKRLAGLKAIKQGGTERWAHPRQAAPMLRGSRGDLTMVQLR